MDATRVTVTAETGIKISKEPMDKLNMIHNEFVSNWRYSINPEITGRSYADIGNLPRRNEGDKRNVNPRDTVIQNYQSISGNEDGSFILWRTLRCNRDASSAQDSVCENCIGSGVWCRKLWNLST